MKTMKDYYDKIDKALKSYEQFKPHHMLNIDWICDRIDWCWKFKHITERQKDELCDRAISVLESEKHTVNNNTE